MNQGLDNEIPKLNEILNQLNAYRTDEIEFVTTPEGLGLLSIASQLKFHRITLFDPHNYNVLKGEFLIEGMRSCNYNGELKFHNTDEREEVSMGAINKKIFNMLEYNLDRTNEIIYSGAPKINAENRLVVVYLHDLDMKYINQIKTSSELLPIRCKDSMPSNSGESQKSLFKKALQKIIERDFTTIYEFMRRYIRGEHNHEKETNNELLKAHTFWRDMVNRYQKRPSIHIRAPEDHDQITDPPEGSFDKEVVLTHFLDGDYKNDYDTAVFHIIVGKNEAESKSDRINKFKNALQLATKEFEKIIITEYNKSSGDFPDHDSALTFNELEDIVDRDAKIEGSVTDKRLVPGNGNRNRNSLIVIEK